MGAALAPVLSGLLDIGLMTPPLLVLLGALAAVWGATKFFWPAEDVRSREEGRMTLIIALVSMFLSGALWAIFDWVDRTQEGAPRKADSGVSVPLGE